MAKQRCSWDGFEYDTEAPEGSVHQQLDELAKQLRKGKHSPWYTKPKDLPAGAQLLRSSPSELTHLVIALAQRVETKGKSWPVRTFLEEFLKALLRRKLPWNEAKLERLLAALIGYDGNANSISWTLLAKQLERFDQEQGLTEPVIEQIRTISNKLTSKSAGLRKASQRLGALIGDTTIPIESGEAWADAALAELDAMGKEQRIQWSELINLALGATAGKPSKKWRTQATQLVEGLGTNDFSERVVRWFALADKPRNDDLPPSHWGPDPNLLLTDSSATILKGLAWCCAGLEHPELARALTALAISAYRKVPEIGPRCVKLGNACVWVLGEMPGLEGVGQLALLRGKVKFGTAQKGIDKALAATSERLGIAEDELEEMGLPTFGLTEVGKRAAMLGGYRAEIVVSGSRASLAWFRPTDDGFRQQKTVPAVIKKDYAAELKEMRAAAKDIQKMLGVQRERLDSLFLAQRKWPLATWKQRYLDHFLLGVMARCLIWRFHGVDGSQNRIQDGIYHQGQLVDCHGEPLEELGEDTEVELWHPLAVSTEEVLAWRRWLESQQVVQPFKQAHREVYLLTDAERNTRTYSNRFAAHVIKQHQFNALCVARGWKNSLRLMVDDDYPPATRELDGWNLRAEYWVEGIGDDYGTDTNDAGTYLRLATDQVRFYRLDAPEHWAHASGGGYEVGRGQTDEPVPLEEVPPLVLSEVMRDVDLFVGVASVGNDPTWQDGGPAGAYRSYWHSYSFGELSATAQTRHDILERLLPRLKIADRCSLDGRFLRVRGDLRGYKIHLGSSNILMEPDDQYLCIVPSGGAVAGPASKVFLPFEGDRILSIVLSKAFLLADDTKIKDPTIVSQIQR